MYDTILIATDGSERSAAAVTHALGLAERYGAAVRALYVVDSRALTVEDEEFVADDGLVDLLRDRGRRATGEVTRRAAARGLDAEATIEVGRPAREIRRDAQENDVDLIAVGTTGRSGLARFMLGSVAESVLADATRPVLTARAAAGDRETGYDDVLLPTDGSGRAERAADHAFDIADRYGATVHAFSVIDSSLVTSPGLLGALERESEAALTAVQRRGADADVDVVTRVWRGTPADCIGRYAVERDVDLVALGAHERRGLDRFLTGNVTRRVVRTVDCPVLSIR